MGYYYILDEWGNPQEEPDHFKWAEWYQNNENRRIATDEIGIFWVSTVFLGLNHNWGGGPPILYETIVFASKDTTVDFSGIEGTMQRYETEEEALQGHAEAVEIVTNITKRLAEKKINE